MSVIEIKYTISAREWQSAFESRFAEDAQPIFYSFFGEVLFCIDGLNILGDQPFEMSIADLAVGLAGVLRDARLENRHACFRQSDDNLQIDFAFDGPVVTVSSSLLASRFWEVDRSCLLTAIQRFVEKFTGELVMNIPLAFEWRDLFQLRPYVVEGGGVVR